MRNYERTEKRIQNTYRSYDYILEKRIGRPSKNTAAELRFAKHIGVFLTGLMVTLLVLSFTVFFGKEPVEASDGVELVKDYICIEIEEGDCLWSIAKEYKTEEFSSVEEVVKEMEEVNGMNKDTLLQPGNKIMVPCYKTVSR